MLVRRLAKISMPRRLRDERSRREDARTNHNARINRSLEAEHGATKVADGCESMHQRLFAAHRHPGADFVPAQLLQIVRRSDNRQVGMAVNQAGNQPASTAVDVSRDILCIARIANRSNRIAGDDDTHRLARNDRRAVEHSNIVNDDRLSRRCHASQEKRSGTN